MAPKLDVDIRKELGAINLTKQFGELVQFRVPTGIIAFDSALGGGIPAGKLTEIYGDFSTSKSRVALHIIAQTIQLGGIGVYLDVERSMEKGLADLVGLDVSSPSFIYVDPNKGLDTIEDVFKVMQKTMMLVRPIYKEKLITIVWDSVAATPGLEDLEKEIGRNEASMRRAKLMSDGLKQIMAEVYKTKVCMIFINQIRDKIGVMWGEKTETVGGKALKFATSLRMHMFIKGKIKDEKTEEVAGMKATMRVDKSKVCPPFREVNYEMYIDKPFDPFTGLLDYMERHGEIRKVGRDEYKYTDGSKAFSEEDFPEVWLKREEAKAKEKK